MTTFKRGDVVLVLFPDSNLRTAKKRPAIVVQADNLQTGLFQVIVALITSDLSRAGRPSRVTVLANSEAGTQTGLRLDSVIVTDNLATIQEKFIERVLGTFHNLKEIERSLAHTFGLNVR